MQGLCLRSGNTINSGTSYLEITPLIAALHWKDISNKSLLKKETSLGWEAGGTAKVKTK